MRCARSQSLDAWPRAIGLINVFVHSLARAMERFIRGSERLDLDRCRASTR